MIWTLAAFLATIAVWPVVMEWQRVPVAKRRTGADASLAPLSEGVTHYRWRGPEDGNVVVCIHGLTTPMIALGAIADGLAADGHRVLTYDLFGRGLSDRPDAHHSRGFFLTQLSQLLRDQGVDGPVTLIGYSMGGSIAAAYTAANPEQVSRLVLLAPAGIRHQPGLMARIAAGVPGLGDWLMLAFGARTLRRSARASRPAVLAVTEALERELKTRGYLQAVLSSQRGMLAETLEDEHRKIASSTVAVTAIWGQADTVIPLAARDRFIALNPGARNTVVHGAAHGLPFTHPGAVLDALRGDDGAGG
ncbi:alpha/beta fold hydrolase [Anianabacter salinae]|uniref:alpha/beta fold hydrolase n=1 Tax=Anianabacter salinae TaxID=2851023 RepID=UPI00225E3802|nr:alpha/beta fold hydrolase [Anianabacter salinae]MBV0913326.1 alpha/beta hydrolase [Anianabacter salinae]